MISKELLEIMACPATDEGKPCHGKVEEKDDKIVCIKCGRRYPIRDGIPIMLVEESKNSE